MMCVEGYSDAAGSYDRTLRNGARYGFAFHVVDSVECGRVCFTFRGQGETLEVVGVQNARKRALRKAGDLNQRDNEHDRHAAV